jgi:membrane fusion protein, macrolide-specific efflux system
MSPDTADRAAPTGVPAPPTTSRTPAGAAMGSSTPVPHRPWYRRWPALVGAVVVLAGAGVLIGVLVSGGSAPDYTASTVATGTVTQTVSATGTLEPATSADANFAVSGDVTSVPVTLGQTVTAGQTLATVATTSLSLAVQEAEATLSGAEASLSSDESSGASSTQLQADQDSVDSAENSLTAAQTDLADATLTAPVAGTVTTVNIAVGDAVSGSGGSDASGANGSDTNGSSAASSSSSSSGSGSSSAAFVIENLTQFTVDASVGASTVSQVKVGDQVDITPASSITTVYGTVSAISSVPTVSSGVATFPVTVTVTGSPSGLYAGTSANVSIVTTVRSGVLVVPSSAVHSTGSSSYVLRLVNGNPVVTAVTLGLVGGSESQISTGLRSGDRVAVPIVTSSGAAGVGRTGFAGGGFGGGLGGFGGGGFGGGGFRQTVGGGGAG